MKTAIVKINRQRWNGVRYVAAKGSEVTAEIVGQYFAIHEPGETLSPFKYTVTHVKTGRALCRTRSKAEARKAVKLALRWPGIDWSRLTTKAAQDEPLQSIGCALLVALAGEGLAADIRVVKGQPKRTLHLLASANG
jgi:hypothetical protein